MKSIKSYKDLWKQISDHDKEIDHIIDHKTNRATNIKDSFDLNQLPRLKLEAFAICDTYIEYVTFRNIDFVNVDFADCYFTKCIFNNCTFNNCVIVRCSFSQYINMGLVKNSTFKCTTIEESLFNCCHIHDCNFTNTCSISGCKFNHSIISGTVIQDSEIAETFSTDIQNTELLNVKTDGQSCPEEGSFIAWKCVTFIDSFHTIGEKVYHVRTAVLAKLRIPEDAKRSSAFSRKCRADKVEVLGFYASDGTKIDDVTEIIGVNCNLERVLGKNYHKTIYKVGETVYPDSFDENRFEECSNGIHFFMNKQDAILFAIDCDVKVVEHVTEDDPAYTKLKEVVHGYNDAANTDS